MTAARDQRRTIRSRIATDSYAMPWAWTTQTRSEDDMTTINLTLTEDEAKDVQWALESHAGELTSQANEDNLNGFEDEAKEMLEAAEHYDAIAEKVSEQIARAVTP